ncbi:MAG: helix-turn-helix domain-containing protein [Erysipelotrichaceae bacterium]|nr:helix-turn-helix domain-containing protein [Erysipelotrichaceae bacterium]
MTTSIKEPPEAPVTSLNVTVNTEALDERIAKLTQLDYQLGQKLDQLQKMPFMDNSADSGEMKIYTTEELAKKLGRSKNYVSKLFRLGLLHGMVMGPSHLFSDEDLRNFWATYRDFDLGTDQKMRLAKQIAGKKKG